MSCYSEKEKKEQTNKQTTTTKKPKTKQTEQNPKPKQQQKDLSNTVEKKKPRTFSNPSGQSSLAHIAVLP